MVRAPRDKGFTLVETLVAMGLLAVLALGATDLIVGVKKSQQNMSNGNDAVLFAAALGQFLNSANCTSGLLGVTFPVGNTVGVPFVINNYKGYGANGAALQNGDQLTLGLRLAPANATTVALDGLFIRDKGVPGVSLGPAGTRYVAQIGLNLQTLTNMNPQTWTPVPTRYFEVPVTVGAGANPPITSCSSTPNLADYCAQTGGTMSNGICTPGGGAAGACQFSGTFATVDCQGVPPTCPPGIPNPNTGTVGCPAGVSGQETGTDSQNLSYTPPGKKASAIPYTQTTTYYVCLKC